jgi:hypothetical protein
LPLERSQVQHGVESAAAAGVVDLPGSRRVGNPYRLPADEVEAKLLEALICTYHQTDLIHEAIETVATHAAADHHDRQRMTAAVDADLVEITSRIDRYLNAFENNTMTEAAAGERVAQLGERARQPKAHRQELVSATEDDHPPVHLTPADLDDTRDEIVQLLNHGSPGARNALSRALIHQIQVTGRHRVKPYFRIPTNSRTPDQGSEVRIVTDRAPRASQKHEPGPAGTRRGAAGATGAESGGRRQSDDPQADQCAVG